MAVNRSKVLQQAEKWVAAGKLGSAVVEYQKLVADNPRDLGTLNKIGDLQVRLNRKPDAISTFTRIAEIFAEDGFFLKAIAIYKKITKIDPAGLGIMRRLAELYSRQGLKTEAKGQFMAVAQAELKGGNPQGAIEAYEALAAMEPESIQHRLALADLKSKCGMPAEAASTLLALAGELQRKGNSKDSARILEMAFKASEGNPEIAERLASSLVASGQHDKALEVAGKVLATHPDSAVMLEVRGLALEATGKTDEAEQILTNCLEYDPERGGAIVGLSRIMAGRGEAKEAVETLSRGMDCIMGAGHGAAAVGVLESILESAPDLRPALEDLYRLQSMLGDTAGIVSAGERLAEASVKGGHFAEALAVARRLVELEPAAVEHAERLQRIEDLSEGKGAVEAPPGDQEEGPAGEEDAAGGIAGMPAPPLQVEESSEIEIEEVPVDGPHEDGAMDGEAVAPAVEHELSSEDEEFIAERVTEADVFVKYGLSDRAAEQLAAIVERFPWHVSTRERLRDLYLEEGNRARAAAEACELGRIRSEEGDAGGARAALAEAESIDPSCPAIVDLRAILTGEPFAEPVEPVEEPEAFGIEVGPAEPEPPADLVFEEEAPAAAGPVAAAAGEAATPESEDDLDLAAELDASLFSAQEAGAGEEVVVQDLEATPEGHSLDEIVSAFRKGIEKQVDSEDFETHYNLGIAYKEMGLVDEAIAEFQFASKSEALAGSCCSMLGVCFREKGMQSLAVKWYRKGLDTLAGGGDEEQLNGLRYDLSEVMEQMGELQQAMDLLTEVYGVNSRYRDVADRMKALGEKIAG